MRPIAAAIAGLTAGAALTSAAFAAQRFMAEEETRQAVTAVKHAILAGLSTDPEITEGRYDLIAVWRCADVAVASRHRHIGYRNPDGSTRLSDCYSFNVFERRNGQWRYTAAFLP